MKKAFTLLELIFVIILIGVLSGIAFYLYRPDSSRADAQYTLLKLKEARYRAIGYDTGSGIPTVESCVVLTPTGLSTNESPRYEIKSTVTLSLTVTSGNLIPHALNGNTICFDVLGRPHDGNSTALSTLFKSDLNATFTNGTKKSIIRLFPQSGYAIIKCNN